VNALKQIDIEMIQKAEIATLSFQREARKNKRRRKKKRRPRRSR
jgi:hypothetical protein